MKAVVIENSFEIDALNIVERPIPLIQSDEILIKVKTVSLNYRDLLMVRGRYNPKQRLPLIPCSDGVGYIVEKGADVTEFSLGDRVIPLFAPNWQSGPPTRERLKETLGGPRDGTLVEFMVMKESQVVPAPEFLSDEQAATLPCAALTAWSALVEQGAIRAGDTIVTQGTGGVSLFALQFARASGANVIATSSSEQKLERLSRLGIMKGINYRAHPEWGRAVRNACNGIGADHIVEVGGSQTLKQSLAACRVGGQISLIGILSGRMGDIDFASVLMNQIRIQGIIVGNRDGFLAMNRAIETHRIQPIVDRVFPLDEVQEAFRYLSSGNHFGKVCVQIH